MVVLFRTIPLDAIASSAGGSRMNRHCKGCKFYERIKAKNLDWCCKRGGPVLVGWCKLNNAKQEKGTGNDPLHL